MELKLLVLLSSLTVVHAPALSELICSDQPIVAHIGEMTESDVIGSHEPVKVTVGQDAILPCHLEPPFDVHNLTVEWERNGKEVHVYRSMDDYVVNEDFKNRTSLFRDEMIKGNISLKLTNVTELDAGTYTCFVPKLQSQVRKGYVNLTVDPVEKSDDRSQTNNKTGDTGAGPRGRAGIAVFAVFTVICIAVCVIVKKLGRIKRRNNRRNMEDRQGNNPEEMQLNNMDPNNP